MPNLELQPNTSNLQSLETEVTLSKQEMEEFRGLPKEEKKKKGKEKADKLKSLNDKLDQAIQGAIQTGQLDEVKRLKELLEEEVNALEEQILTIELTFDPEKEITEEDIHIMEGQLEKLRQANYWSDYLSVAKSLKIINPERKIELDSNVLSMILKEKSEGSSGESFNSFLRHLADAIIADPEVDFLTAVGFGKEEWDLTKREYLKQRGYSESMIPNAWDVVIDAKIIDPNQDIVKANPVDLQKIEKDLKRWRYGYQGLQVRWDIFIQEATIVKLLFPDVNLNLDSEAWKNMKEQRAQDKKIAIDIKNRKDATFLQMDASFSRRTAAMKILSADRVEITDKGLKITANKEVEEIK